MNSTLKIGDEISEDQKKFLVSLFTDVFNACFAQRIDGCKTFLELKRLIDTNAEGIGDYLGLDIVDHYEQREKDKEIDNLEEENRMLERRLIKYESLSLLDQWKNEILDVYLPNLTPLELEQRLRN